MCRPWISNGSWVWSVPRREAALREVVAVQRARDHAGRARQPEVVLQPLGEPGAAGPDADERAFRLEQAAHTGEQLGVERFGVELVEACSQVRQELLEDDRRRGGVEIGARRRAWPRSSCSARRPRAPAGRNAPSAGARSGARARCSRAARRRDGTARRRRAPPGCHSAISAAIAARRASPSATTVVSGVAVRVSELPVATPTRRVPKSKARKERGCGGHCESRAHACPASELSMLASMPSSDSALP